MVLICGIPSESPLEMVITHLQKMRIPTIIFNQRNFADAAIEYTIDKDGIKGWLYYEDAAYRLEEIRAVYYRLMDYRQLPELKNVASGSAELESCARLHSLLDEWLEATDARVVNRHKAMASNNSKPYQLQLIEEAGFKVPATIVTTDADAVRQFRKTYKRIIFKSISGQRSIVKEYSTDDEQRLPLLKWCPAQFQQYIDGDNLRVHVIGQRLFATHITAKAIDYRYAFKETGEEAELTPITLSKKLEKNCLMLAQKLKLPFAGIDLKIASSGEVYCFEVNPSPGYSYFEANSGQPIARALAEYLAYGDA